MSASRPPGTISTPNTSAYALSTHWTVVTSVSKSFSIWGSATLSAVRSLAITKTEIPIAPSASQVPRVTGESYARGTRRLSR